MEIKKQIAEFIDAKHDGNASTDDIVNFLFETGIIDERRCEIAAVKRFYSGLMRNDQELRSKDARAMTAEKFYISDKKVETFIYQYPHINFDY